MLHLRIRLPYHERADAQLRRAVTDHFPVDTRVAWNVMRLARGVPEEVWMVAYAIPPSSVSAVVGLGSPIEDELNRHGRGLLRGRLQAIVSYAIPASAILACLTPPGTTHHQDPERTVREHNKAMTEADRSRTRHVGYAGSPRRLTKPSRTACSTSFSFNL